MGQKSMIKPTKFSHPDKTVVSIALLILEHIKQKRLVPFDDLRKYVRSKRQGVDSLIIPSIDFLFLLGVVEYREKSDSLEYTVINNAAV